MSLDVSRNSVTEIYTSIQTNLAAALPYLKEKRNERWTDANVGLFVSKDVARILMAYVHVALKEYHKAIPLLEKVIDDNYYGLGNGAANVFNERECILGIQQEPNKPVISILDYRELLLVAAECYLHTDQGRKASALIQQIADAKNIVLDGDDSLNNIARLRLDCKLNFTVPFIRRNNLGLPILGLDSNDQYRLLYPIPTRELYVDPNMTQNPGY